MKKCISWLLVLSALSCVCLQEPQAADLSQTWSMNDTIDEKSLDRLLQLLKEDQQTNELLSAVLERLGAQGAEDLLQIVRLCPELQGTQKGGQFRFALQDSFLPETPGITPHPEAVRDMEKAVEQSFAHMERTTALGREVKTLLEPSICLRPESSLLDSFSSFVHELTHFLKKDISWQSSVLNYQDADDYVLKVLEKKGGELEAYLAEGYAIKKAQARYGVKSRQKLGQFFDEQGRVTDLNGLKKFILDDLQYRQTLMTDFKNEVVLEFKANVQRQSTYLRMKAGMEKTLSVSEKNIEISKRNISLFEEEKKLDDAKQWQEKLEHFENRRDQILQGLSDIDEAFAELQRQQSALCSRLGQYLDACNQGMNVAESL